MTILSQFSCWKSWPLVELVMYPWIDTGVIQSFRIRTTTKKKIRGEMTPPPPLITINLSFTLTWQRPWSDNETPIFPSSNFKTNCSCPFHRIYVFSDTAMLVKNVYSTITNNQVSLSPKQSQHRVRVGSKEQERSEGVEKLEMMWSSGFELFRHRYCEKRKKNQLLRFKDGSTYYHFCVSIIFTTSHLFFHKRLFIIGWNNRSRSRKVSYQSFQISS